MNAQIINQVFKSIQCFFNRKKEYDFEFNDESQLPNNDQEDSSFKLLKNLKQLEFVSYFEMQIQNNNEENYSLEFLQTLDLMRAESKQQTIQLIYNFAA